GNSWADGLPPWYSRPAAQPWSLGGARETMLKDRYRTSLRKKFKRRARGYPMATVAYYGPDDQRASKVAVGIIRAENEEPAVLERWTSEDTDVRFDPPINRAILELIRRHNARSVVTADRIIGCPHEEGADYPEGETCPACPFWAHRDRWSGEIIH
ncbi:MAG: hypothetical protein ACREA0_29215, partial [bacterium]